SGPHRGHYAAATPSNGFVRDAVEAILPLVAAVAGIDDMSMAIDQAGCNPSAVAVVVLLRVSAGWQLALRPQPGDSSVLDCQGSMGNVTVAVGRIHGCDVYVGPKRIPSV